MRGPEITNEMSFHETNRCLPREGLIFLGRYLFVDFKGSLDDKVILGISANCCSNNFVRDDLNINCIYTHQKKMKQQRIFSLNLANDEGFFEWAARNPLVHLPAPARAQ